MVSTTIPLNGSDADTESEPKSKPKTEPAASPRPHETAAGGGVAVAEPTAAVPSVDKSDTKGGDNAMTMDDAAAKKPKKKKIVKKKVKKKKKKQEEQHVAGMGFTSNSILGP